MIKPAAAATTVKLTTAAALCHNCRPSIHLFFLPFIRPFFLLFIHLFIRLFFLLFIRLFFPRPYACSSAEPACVRSFNHLPGVHLDNTPYHTKTAVFRQRYRTAVRAVRCRSPYGIGYSRRFRCSGCFSGQFNNRHSAAHTAALFLLEPDIRAIAALAVCPLSSKNTFGIFSHINKTTAAAANKIAPTPQYRKIQWYSPARCSKFCVRIISHLLPLVSPRLWQKQPLYFFVPGGYYSEALQQAVFHNFLTFPIRTVLILTRRGACPCSAQPQQTPAPSRPV